MSLPPARLFAADRPSGSDPAHYTPDAERALRETIPVFVNSFNQLTYLRDTLEWFAANGFRNICVVDQASSFPPLLAFYDSPSFKAAARLWRLNENVGPRTALDASPLVRWALPHIFTDPDLRLPAPPAVDLLTRLFTVSRRYRVHKVGLALDLSDADQFHERKLHCASLGRPVSITEHENQFWREEVEQDVYRAAIDTTFHLFNPSPGLGWRNLRRKMQARPMKMVGLRVAGAGFVAGHRPWYRDDGQTADERAFYASIDTPWSNWTAGAAAQ